MALVEGQRVGADEPAAALAFPAGTTGTTAEASATATATGGIFSNRHTGQGQLGVAGV